MLNSHIYVSILVLMDLCIKTKIMLRVAIELGVSILVLMDLCIKTRFARGIFWGKGKVSSLF